MAVLEAPAARRRQLPPLEPLSAAEPAIGFRPLERGDAERLRDWLNAPHVATWWGVGSGPDGIGAAGDDAATTEQVLTQFGASLDGRGSAHMYLVLADGEPVGLIQWYRLADEPAYAAAIGELDGAGLDVLLGDPEMVGHGLGRRVIDRFVTEVVFAAPGIDRCVAGPDVRNRRSIAAFRAAGFEALRDAQVPDEPAPERIMVRRGPTPRSGAG